MVNKNIQLGKKKLINFNYSKGIILPRFWFISQQIDNLPSVFLSMDPEGRLIISKEKIK